MTAIRTRCVCVWAKQRPVAGAIVIDPVEHLCVDQQCPVVTFDGKPVYKDDNHYRPFFVKEHAVFIDMALQD